MKTKSALLCLPLLALLLFSCESPRTEELPAPHKKADGSAFRIAVVQSGDYVFYNAVLSGIHAGLSDLGWVEPGPPDLRVEQPIPSLLEAWESESSPVWFDPPLFLDLKFAESDAIPDALKALVDGSQGADLVISLGTVAGKLIASAEKQGLVRVPVMIESVSDPVGSGIIHSTEDSGSEHLTATTDPGQYERQIRLFHRIARFHRLGMIYTDSETGRAYAALATVQKVAKELDFEIVADTGVLEDPADESGIPAAEEAYLKAFERISAMNVDAVFVTIQAGLTTRTVPLVAERALKARMPTFAMEGSDLVRAGLLSGESRKVQVAEGLFSAEKAVRLLSGSRARTLSQVLVHKPHIALNLITARSIGFTIPPDVLLEADEVYGP